MKNIRNFCIIAHIDHGKSTLADRLIEMTQAVEERKMKEQLLDTMDLERERGITIKLQPVNMIYQAPSGEDFLFNLIDTPGHVDFGYEVSRSLAAVEGAILLVDASQGIQAQTLANLYQALDQDLEIIPVLNKIDLPNAEPEKHKKELMSLIGCREEDILLVSGKTGEGVDKLLEQIANKIPAPNKSNKKFGVVGELKKDQKLPASRKLRAMIFDSKYDSFKGVLAFVRIVEGSVCKEDDIKLLVGGVEAHIIEVGKFAPELVPTEKLVAGEIGYIATGLKSVKNCRVGDTITFSNKMKARVENIEIASKPLPGYREVRPMVYASFYPVEGEDYNQVRDALEKLQLNDAALTFEGESSLALGRGFRIGFLGLLHLEIVKERLRREFGFEPVITTPSVVYEIVRTSNEVEQIFSAAEMPEANMIKEIREPFVRLEIVSPATYLGQIMEVVTATTRAEYVSTDYIDEARINVIFDAPLSEVIVNLHDNLQSATSGYASFSYSVSGYRASDLVRMDIYVAEEMVEAFARIVPRNQVNAEGKRLVTKLKEVVPRQNFQVKLQAAIGGKFVARENITPFRKDVTGHLYGGDYSRKRKLLEKQKKGKKRMKSSGRVDIPQSAFLEVLKK